jgi:uncharacterized protein (TIGR02147 family)
MFAVGKQGAVNCRAPKAGFMDKDPVYTVKQAVANQEQASNRSLLHSELRRRQSQNPRYSLRALARDLRISPAFLSQVLNGRKKLSFLRAREVTRHSGWNRRISEAFLELAQAESFGESAPSARKRRMALRLLGNEQEFAAVPIEMFRLVSEWYHFAILELTAMDDLKLTPKLVGRKLGLSERTTRAALENLQRVGLITVDARHGIRKIIGNYSTGDVPSLAIRQFHRQLLKKASEAIVEQSVEHRDFSGITMAIDPRKIPKAKKMIKDFRRELMTVLESGERKAVYHFSAQLFRLDRED